LLWICKLLKAPLKLGFSFHFFTTHNHFWRGGRRGLSCPAVWTKYGHFWRAITDSCPYRTPQVNCTTESFCYFGNAVTDSCRYTTTQVNCLKEPFLSQFLPRNQLGMKKPHLIFVEQPLRFYCGFQNLF
jgi:hypothetical protein